MIRRIIKQTVTKKDFISALSQETRKRPNDIRSVIQTFMEKVIELLARGNRLEFRDFGIFDVVCRRPKIGRNPKRAEIPIVIPSRNVVKFTPGKRMRQMVEREGL